MNTSCSQAVICIAPSCSSFFDSEDGFIDSNSVVQYFGENLWDDSDRKKNKPKPCGRLTFSVGETSDLSFGIECQNDVSVDRPDMAKDINEAPEATTKIEAQTNDNVIQMCFSSKENSDI